MKNQIPDTLPTLWACQPQRPCTTSARSSGFSLLENVMALSLFTLLAVGISGLLVQSNRIAENNRLRHTAYTTAQGYLEQIQALPAKDIQLALQTPDQVPLLPVQVNATGGDTTFLPDPLFIDGSAPPLQNALSGSNYRRISLYRPQTASQNTQATTADEGVYMDLWLDLAVNPFSGQPNTYEIVLRFAWHPRGNSTSFQYGELRTLKTDLTL